MLHGPPEAAAGPTPPPRGRLVFGEFEFDLDRGSLLWQGEEIALRPKSLAMLEHLLTNAGRLVPREELMAAVWPDVVVTDDSIAQCLIDLRRALGDEQRTLIRTVPRRGLIFELPVRHEHVGDPVTESRAAQVSRARWPLAAALAVTAAALAWWTTSHRPELQPVHQPQPQTQPPTAATTDGIAIAVLRFTDMSPNSDHAYLGEGLSEEIMHLLAQVPSLRVIARTSSFAVAGQPVGRIASQLGVTHVLEGSVRSQGDQVRVTAQLIDATTSTHLWSRSYERGLDDFLDLQREIAGSVAASLQVSLADAGAPDAQAVDPHAYQLFLEGRHFYLRRADGDLERAQQRYEQAVAISPGFARAWIGLAAVASLRLYSPLDAEANPAERERLGWAEGYAVEQALQHGPNLAEVQARAARYFFSQGERERALRHFEMARAIDPNHWLVLAKLADESAQQGRIDQAVALMTRNMQRDPLNLVTRENMVNMLLWAGRNDEAQAELERVDELATVLARQSPYLQRHRARLQIAQGNYEAALQTAETMLGDMDRLQVRAIALHHLGQSAESDAALQQVIALARDEQGALSVAEVFAQRGDEARAGEWLERIALGSECRLPKVSTFVYYSPLLTALPPAPAWDDYRQQVLQDMRSCLWGIDIGSATLAASGG